MRWGNWYLHDESTVKHQPTGAIVPRDLFLDGPPAVDLWLLANCDELGLSVGDAVHLHLAANTLEWCAWDYTGMGDWTDEDGVQRGAQASRRAHG